MNHALKLMLLCGLAPALVSGLSARALAQMAEQPPLLQVEGTLQADDETLSDGRFYDVHEFTGKADQAVTLLLESEAFDPTLALVDDQGNIIATNNDISSENANAALLTVLPATGRYRVIANAAQAETTQGPYRLAIHSTPASGPNPLLSGVEVTLLEAEQLFQSGLEYYQRSELRDALSLWEEALSRFRDYEVRVAFLQDSRQGEAKALISLGIAYLALGDYERAIDFQQQALDLTRQLGNRQGEANALGNLGIAYLALGDHERTIGFMQQALDLTRQLGNRQGEANALMSLGIAYLALGDYERAIDSMQEALDITRQSELASLGRPGSTYDAFDYERAIDFLQEVLDSARQRHRLDELASLRRLGSASDALDYEQTRDFYQQSLDLARQLGNRPFEQIALVNLGLMHLVFDDYDLAIDSTQQALDLARQSGHRLVEGVSLHNLGLAFRGLDNLAEAAQYFESSALVQESLHSKGLADAHRLSLLDSQQVTYLLWQMTLMAQGQPQPALAVAERGRAQALAASMSRALTTENDAAWTPPAPPTLEQIQAIAIQQQATLVEYAVLPNGRILIWVIQPDGTIHATESDAQALDDSLEDTVALFADLGQNGRGGPPPETPLSDLVQDTQAALTTVRGTPSNATQLSRQDLDNNLKQLHNALIDPIQQWLPTDETQRVIFIPHRELFRVPFAALKDDQDTFLIEKHTLLTAPSIQSLALARQHSDRIQTANATDALIVGNPTLPNALTASYGWKQLPGAEDEAGKVGDTLSNYLGTDINALTQNEATETAVKQRLHTARFIHLATHGTLASGAADSNPKPETETSGAEDNSQPPAAPTTNGLQYSTIPGVLALAATGEDDGALTADELLEMTISNPLNAELVVLSACQTGQGPITSDGVYGLSRTLLTAGVPTLVVSLWNASDTHTVDLMDEFYRQFLEQDQDKAQALRQAMLKMINEGDPNPQYWAAFTLVGDAQ